MFQKFSIIFVIITILSCHITNLNADNSWLGPEWGVIQKVYDDCHVTDDFTGCLKGRALVALNRAVDQVYSK